MDVYSFLPEKYFIAKVIVKRSPITFLEYTMTFYDVACNDRDQRVQLVLFKNYKDLSL